MLITNLLEGNRGDFQIASDGRWEVVPGSTKTLVDIGLGSGVQAVVSVGFTITTPMGIRVREKFIRAPGVSKSDSTCNFFF